jgi:hypothetical protein
VASKSQFPYGDWLFAILALINLDVLCQEKLLFSLDISLQATAGGWHGKRRTDCDVE